MPGTHTPILFPAEFQKANPDYVFITAWNYAPVITAKESWYTRRLVRAPARSAILLSMPSGQWSWCSARPGCSARPCSTGCARGSLAGGSTAADAGAMRGRRSTRRQDVRASGNSSGWPRTRRGQLHRRPQAGDRREPSGQSRAGGPRQRAVSARTCRRRGASTDRQGHPRFDRRGIFGPARSNRTRRTPHPIRLTPTVRPSCSARARRTTSSIVRCSIVGRDRRRRGLVEWYLRRRPQHPVTGFVDYVWTPVNDRAGRRLVRSR